MKIGSNLVKINRDYLCEIVQKAGISQSEVSRSIGRNMNYISQAKSRGEMQLPAAQLLCKLYGANVMDLLEMQDTPEPEKQKKKPDNLNAETLARIEKKLDFLIRKLG